MSVSCRLVQFMGDWELGVFPGRSAAAEHFDGSQAAWSYSERWQPPGENLHSAQAAASTKPKVKEQGVNHERRSPIVLPGILCKCV